MKTSSFFSKGGKDENAVAICRGLPKWYEGRVYKKLAPTWAMLKMSEAEFESAYRSQVLGGLNAAQVYDELGADAVLLCWEPFNVRCHRRLVAEWLESELGVEIPEFGYERADSIPFCDQRRAEKKPKPEPEPVAVKPPERTVAQRNLF